METRLITFVSRLSPWIITLPTAYAIGESVYTIIGWPAIVAIITALAIETMGIGVTNTALELYAYNRSKRKSDPTAPLWLSVALVVIYYVATIILTAVLEGNAVLALFPALSAVAAGTLALRADQAARVATIKKEKEDKHNAAHDAHKPAELPASKTYPCDLCGASFDSQQKQAAHKRWQHKKAEDL